MLTFFSDRLYHRSPFPAMAGPIQPEVGLPNNISLPGFSVLPFVGVPI